MEAFARHDALMSQVAVLDCKWVSQLGTRQIKQSSSTQSQPFFHSESSSPQSRQNSKRKITASSQRVSTSSRQGQPATVKSRSSRVANSFSATRAASLPTPRTPSWRPNWPLPQRRKKASNPQPNEATQRPAFSYLHPLR